MFVEVIFFAYFRMSCINLGEVYNYPTTYKLGQGCFTNKGTFLTRANDDNCNPCSVVTSSIAHEIMYRETKSTK